MHCPIQSRWQPPQNHVHPGNNMVSVFLQAPCVSQRPSFYLCANLESHSSHCWQSRWCLILQVDLDVVLLVPPHLLDSLLVPKFNGRGKTHFSSRNPFSRHSWPSFPACLCLLSKVFGTGKLSFVARSWQKDSRAPMSQLVVNPIGEQLVMVPVMEWGWCFPTCGTVSEKWHHDVLLPHLAYKPVSV